MVASGATPVNLQPRQLALKNEQIPRELGLPLGAPCDYAGNMGPVVVLVEGGISGLRVGVVVRADVSRGIRASDEVVPAFYLETRAVAGTERGMGVEDSRVDDGDPDALAQNTGGVDPVDASEAMQVVGQVGGYLVFRNAPFVNLLDSTAGVRDVEHDPVGRPRAGNFLP